MMLWLFLICMSLFVLGVVALSYLLKREPTLHSRDAVNQSLYHARLEELDKETRLGLSGDEKAQHRELQLNLLDDTAKQGHEQTQAPKKLSRLIPALVFTLLSAPLLYFQLGAHETFSHWQQVQARFPKLSQQVLEADSSLTKQDFGDFALGLRTQLYKHPNDTEGWLLLSRLGQVLGKGEMMVNAAQQSYARQPNNPNAIAIYAQSLLMKDDANETQRASILLANALRSHSNDVELWSIYAFIAMQQGQTIQAIERWQQMLSLLAPDSERYRLVEQSIDFAKASLSQEQAQPIDSSAEPTPQLSYRIMISLDEAIQLDEQNVLFVFAQAVDGPQIPLAAKKLPVSRFPLSVTLSQADAMIEGMSLATQSTFYVTARLSSDDNIQSRSGDWQGRSVAVNAGEQDVIKVVINAQLP